MKSILVFLLFAATLCWMMFSPVYKHVLVMRQAVLQKEVDYLLEVAANGDHGYIDERMRAASAERLAGYGFRPDALVYEVGSDTGMMADDPGAPLPRGMGLMLSITYPYERLFEIDRLIGLTPPSEHMRLRASGIKMSEYVP